MTVTLICQQCGKSFIGKISAKYCSRACSGLASRNSVTRVCVQCGQSFTLRAGMMPKERQFCSWNCYQSHVQSQNTRTCELCGKPFHTRRNGDIYQRFCSKRCAGQAKGSQPMTCQECGKQFRIKSSRAAKGWGKYCSRMCSQTALRRSPPTKTLPETELKIIQTYQAGKSSMQVAKENDCSHENVRQVLKRNGITMRTYSQAAKGKPPVTAEIRQKISSNHADVSGERNPMFGRPPGHGRSIFVPHLNRKVRSTWEAAIAQHLLDLNIDHQYEAHRLVLNAECTYMPDFFLPTYNLYIEVKGWENARFKKILSLLGQEHINIRLLIIGPKQYPSILERPQLLLDLIEQTSRTASPHISYGAILDA